VQGADAGSSFDARYEETNPDSGLSYINWCETPASSLLDIRIRCSAVAECFGYRYRFKITSAGDGALPDGSTGEGDPDLSAGGRSAAAVAGSAVAACLAAALAAALV
jgi:hypothetical protein